MIDRKWTNDEYRAIGPFCSFVVMNEDIEKMERQIDKYTSRYPRIFPGSHMIRAEVCILPFLVFVRSPSEFTIYAYSCYLQNYS